MAFSSLNHPLNFRKNHPKGLNFGEPSYGGNLTLLTSSNLRFTFAFGNLQ